MSRTYRRTKRTYTPKWVIYDWTPAGKDYLEGEELVKALNKWHADGQYCNDSPPQWYRAYLWRVERHKMNRELIKYAKIEEYEPQIIANPRWPYWD